MSKWIRRGVLPGVCLLALAAAGCGDLVRQGHGPNLGMVTLLEGASGATPGEFGGTLSSDVITYVERDINGATVQVPTVFADVGRATVSVEMKDPATAPTTINTVTFTRYRVEFFRADGRNTPGVDVPYGFDSAVTFSAAPGDPGTAGFELIRHTTKTEAPLVALANNLQFITAIARVTFYGTDHAGNDVTAVGQIGVTFGNFGDPE